MKKAARWTVRSIGGDIAYVYKDNFRNRTTANVGREVDVGTEAAWALEVGREMMSEVAEPAFRIAAAKFGVFRLENVIFFNAGILWVFGSGLGVLRVWDDWMNRL